MRLKILVLLFLVTSAACTTQATESADAHRSDSSTQNAHKAKRVNELLAQHPLHLSRVTKSGKHTGFCEAFFGEFKAQRHIEYIEPILRTDDINHVGLKPYRACLNYDHPSDVDPDIRYYDLPQLGDRGFRTYRLDQYGLGELLYVELDPNRAKAKRIPGYWGIDPKHCKLVDFVPISQSESSSFPFRRENYNALINYKGSYVVFSLEDMRTRESGTPRYQLRVFKYQKGEGFINICRWTWKRN